MTNIQSLSRLSCGTVTGDSSGRAGAEQRPGTKGTLPGRSPSTHAAPGPRGCTPARLHQNRFALRKAEKSGFYRQRP